MKSILLVTGSFPPDICGVGDYTKLLADELKKRIPQVLVFYRSDWSLRTLMQYARQIRRSGVQVINIQYPTRGYGHSIVPHLLSLITGSAKKVVTLHEFSRASMTGRLSMCLFFLSVDMVVFTTDYERQAACRFAPWMRRKSFTIHIGSNIPFRCLSSGDRDIDIAYFGHISPTKGLEEFAIAIAKVNRDRSLNIRVIGQIPTGYERYGTMICERLKDLGVEVTIDKPADDVSDLLARVRIALLPFPDGMSLRRGSALAAMGNGVLLLTTESVCDSTVLEGKCLMARDPTELGEMLAQILNDYAAYDSVRIAGQEFARCFSWDRVISDYIRIIDAL